MNRKALRVGIDEELRAVTLYEDLLAKATDPRVKELFRHIIAEEKQHAKEFKELLAKY